MTVCDIEGKGVKFSPKKCGILLNGPSGLCRGNAREMHPSMAVA